MKRQLIRIMALAAVLLLTVAALAQGTISTTVVMRVSHMTQNAVVDAGEDLSMEVSIDGVTPASYQWYFNDAIIDGADQRVYTIANAAVEDTGVYRLDAFDEAGRMVVSMDISARVVDNTVPKAGDNSLPTGVVAGAMALAALGLAWMMLRRKAEA
ncbi:MAG: immunoglobulin domain-containing protein [Clostridia bacterium]|nr:immunoglobulin domain-containing protein [Clostridia bacterium]